VQPRDGRKPARSSGTQMNRWLIGFAILLVVVGAVFLSWTTSVVHDRAVRSRLTLTVETPEGVRTGSSVTEKTTTFGPFQLKRSSAPGWSMGTFLIGEGVVVDLGKRGLLVATLVKPSWLKDHGWSGGGGYAVSPFSETVDSRNSPDGLSDAERYMLHLDEVKRLKPKADISLKELPVLVRFNDATNPTSMSLVDPSDLAGAFGAGVKLKTATVEVSDDPVTHSIEGHLPWLKQNRLPKFDDYILPLPSPGYEWVDPHPPNFRYSVFLKPQ
jgi:hypothetical protein